MHAFLPESPEEVEKEGGDAEMKDKDAGESEADAKQTSKGKGTVAMKQKGKKKKQKKQLVNGGNDAEGEYWRSLCIDNLVYLML